MLFRAVRAHLHPHHHRVYMPCTLIMPSIQARSRRRQRLLRTPTHATTEHVPNHVKHGVSLLGYLDTKVHLANLIQRLAPVDILQVRRIVALELPEQAGVTPLDTQQQHGEEVQQRQAGVDTQIRGSGRDLLGAEVRLIGEQRREEQEELVGCAQVACEQVWEDAARRVQRRRVRVVG